MPAQGKYPKAGKHVEVVVAGVVVQVRAFGARVDLVEADRVQHARQLRVQVPGLQFVTFSAALFDQRGQVEGRHDGRLTDRRDRRPVGHILGTRWE